MAVRLLEKPCERCGGELWSKVSFRQYCDSCRIEVRRERDKLRQRTVRSTDEYKLKYRRYTVERNYGLSWEDYEAMLARQDGRCAICRTSNPGKKAWHVDHNHENGDVRGLLCSDCNLTLGKINDSVEVLYSMIRYLKPAGWQPPNIKEVLGLD